MITVIASENVVASLINQEFESMLNEYQWEQETRWERETMAYLRNVEQDMRNAYERGDREAFSALWSHYSDVYKDVHNVRPRWFFDTCEWYYGPLS